MKRPEATRHSATACDAVAVIRQMMFRGQWADIFQSIESCAGSWLKAFRLQYRQKPVVLFIA